MAATGAKLSYVYEYDTKNDRSIEANLSVSASLVDDIHRLSQVNRRIYRPPLVSVSLSVMSVALHICFWILCMGQWKNATDPGDRSSFSKTKTPR